MAFFHCLYVLDIQMFSSMSDAAYFSKSQKLTSHLSSVYFVLLENQTTFESQCGICIHIWRPARLPGPAELCTAFLLSETVLVVPSWPKRELGPPKDLTALL